MRTHVHTHTHKEIPCSESCKLLLFPMMEDFPLPYQTTEDCVKPEIFDFWMMK